MRRKTLSLAARRQAGASKYNIAKMINLAADGIMSFSRLPLRLVTLAGVGAVAAGFTSALWSRSLEAT